MESEDVLKLLEMRAELVETVDFETVAPGLLQHKLMTVAEYEAVTLLAADRKVAALLDLLPAKTSSVLRLLGQVLREDYDWLASGLQHCQVSQVTRQRWQSEQSSYNSTNSSSNTSTSSSSNTGASISTSSNSDTSVSLSSHSGDKSRSQESSQPCSSPSSQSSPLLSSLPSHCPSPLHSSEFSLSSCHSSKRLLEVEEELDEPAIQFVQSNPRVMRRWSQLAHALGLTHRVEVIKARVRRDGGDLDEHVGEVLREWQEERGREATLPSLVRVLRGQGFNDTAERLEDGSYLKRSRR